QPLRRGDRVRLLVDGKVETSLPAHQHAPRAAPAYRGNELEAEDTAIEADCTLKVARRIRDGADGRDVDMLILLDAGHTDHPVSEWSRYAGASAVANATDGVLA